MPKGIRALIFTLCLSLLPLGDVVWATPNKPVMGVTLNRQTYTLPPEPARPWIPMPKRLKRKLMREVRMERRMAAAKATATQSEAATKATFVDEAPMQEETGGGIGKVGGGIGKVGGGIGKVGADGE